MWVRGLIQSLIFYDREFFRTKKKINFFGSKSDFDPKNLIHDRECSKEIEQLDQERELPLSQLPVATLESGSKVPCKT